MVLDNQEMLPLREVSLLSLEGRTLDDPQVQRHNQHIDRLLPHVEPEKFVEVVEQNRLCAQAHEQVHLLQHNYQNSERFGS